MIASLNAAVFGFAPERPILGENGDYLLDHCAPALDFHAPLVTVGENRIRLAITEIRADWKFYKVFFLATAL